MLREDKKNDLRSSTSRFLNSFNGKNNDVVDYEGEKVVNKITNSKSEYSEQEKISDTKIYRIKKTKTKRS